MGRILAVWVVGVVCAGFWASSVGAQEEVPFFSADGNHAAHQRIWGALQKPLPESGLDFTDTALEEVVAYLREEFEIEIQIDDQALEDLGIDIATPITTKLHNISLRSALNLILTELELTYVITDEVLLITTQEEADTRLIVCVYPVRDLIDPQYQPTKAEKEGGSPPEMVPIIDTIISTITYDTWSENGGGEAEIMALRPGLLVISQTQDIHEQIRNTLAAIRRGKQFAEQNQPAATPAEVGGGGGFGWSGFGGEEGGFGNGGFGGGGVREAAPREEAADANPFGS
jgi:hypothetical protein